MYLISYEKAVVGWYTVYIQFFNLFTLSWDPDTLSVKEARAGALLLGDAALSVSWGSENCVTASVLGLLLH